MIVDGKILLHLHHARIQNFISGGTRDMYFPGGGGV